MYTTFKVQFKSRCNYFNGGCALCSRFFLYSTYPRLAHRIGELRVDVPPAPRYNVAPGTWISSIRRQADDPQLTFDNVWWGYKPKWAGETAPQPINARVETVATSKFYQAAFQRHRCLIPADGWFEATRPQPQAAAFSVP